MEGCSALDRAPGLLLVHNTPKGRAVVASEFIAKGTIVDVSPVLVFTPKEVEKTGQTCLNHYTYYWPSPEGGPQTQAIALGLGSMFNHSLLQQNIAWSRDLVAKTLIYTALKDIKPGDELCISYGNVRLWFNDADPAEDDRQSTNEDDFIQAGFADLSLSSSNDGPQ